MKIKILPLFIVIAVCQWANAQVSDDFKIRYQDFLTGEIKVIGNHILNREEKNATANEPYNITGKDARSNDEMYMKYIDIDGDPQTFSSSSATFEKDKEGQKTIAYAGLYWAGTYPYKEGTFAKGKIKITDEERLPVDEVWLKLPGGTYRTVKGEVLHDGINDEAQATTAPYVCYADVTDLVAGLEDMHGEYTVANVRAANGSVEGGSSAGWSLVLVYRERVSALKKIISYDGFLPMHKEEKSLVFSGFKIPESGNFDIRILGAAIEGDMKMSGDQVFLSSPEGVGKVTLSSAIRPQRNFFNSSITRDDEYQQGRTPSSSNTLGFDIFDRQIKDAAHDVIPHSSEELYLTFARTNDRYYLYHTALQIESQPAASDIAIAKMEIVPEERETVVKTTETAEVESGYYTIIGVFLNMSNVRKLTEKAKEKGIEASYIHIKEEFLNYVYTNRYTSLEDALGKIEQLRNHEAFKDAWILYVKR